MFESDSVPAKIAKYSILLSIKESYLLTRNWLGLFTHPFKTLRALFREKDYSQILLVIGFPIYFLFIGLFTIWAARRIVGVTPGIWGWPTKSGVLFLLFITSTTFMYLGYWIIQVFKVQKS